MEEVQDNEAAFISEDDESQYPSENLEGFKDFTVASSWERFIAAVESVFQEWSNIGATGFLADGVSAGRQVAGAEPVEGFENLLRIVSEVSYGYKKYRMELFFPKASHESNDEWIFGLHHLQLCFGVKEFMVVAPVSMSGVVLDAADATFLLSTVEVALSNSGRVWPVFVPVHDPTRKAYFGIQNSMGSFSIRYEADRVDTQVPVKLMHLEGLYDLFLSKLGYADSHFPTSRRMTLVLTMKLTYKVSLGHSLPETELHIETVNEVPGSTQWDDECPWAEWHSMEDPVKGFELITTWRNRYIDSSVDMAELENASTFEADNWFLRPKLFLTDDPQSGSLGFAGRLHALIMSFVLTKEAEFMEDFASAVNHQIRDVSHAFRVPPPTVLDRILRDLFYEGGVLTPSNKGHKYAGKLKGAPLDSLFGRFCLHALWFGNCNIRAISVLWIEFVREVRWCWEETQPLPRCQIGDPMDFNACLIYQKLQLLAECIKQKSMQRLTTNNQSDDKSYGHTFVAAESARSSVFPESQKKMRMMHDIEDENSTCATLEDANGENEIDSKRRGSAGPAGKLRLLKSGHRLHAPLTQSPPVMTEDMLQEREQALSVLDNSPSGKRTRIRLQSDLLVSDMAAFKAANPGAQFEDFIQWHSPRDWIENNLHEKDKGVKEAAGDIDMRSPGRLSQRMGEPGNTWEQIWKSVDPLPASEQKPIFDYTREGEKVIHYLDTLKPHQLLAQMICTSFSAAAHILFTAPGSSIPPMSSEIDDLYILMGSLVNPLAKVTISDEEMLQHVHEWQKNLLQVYAYFEKAEKDVALAASLKQKLSKAPNRLLAALLDSPLKKTNKSTVGETYEEPYTVLETYNERQVVADSVFAPADDEHVWKESLRMGNFLNGHEPRSREIVFSYWDGHSDTYSGARVSKEECNKRQKSHRMYIHGTANDLQVALAIVSND